MTDATGTCPATKTTTTATGDIEVRCSKILKHVAQGDPVHEAKLGVFPIRWRDA
ncbi:hypothetical protein [Dactylosporangium darangshiense]|uniref:Uncharacterized protein n=1 Tax=Dactylosporangium darangshiense TaxID=579108 RepID=A0ABP8DWA2_9ACTN